jgi:retron-type reverse transcriptase
MDFINKNEVLFNTQYGFRKNHSTALALLHLVDSITSSIDQKKFTVGIFIDLSKAFFDTVNHKILLEKLQHYGIRGLALDWIRNYLSDRYQFVEYNGFQSSSNEIKCGVPQGSILGPLFFLLYINDICNVSSILNFILFADDTNLFLSHNDLSFMRNTINSELLKLSEWFKANKLSINVQKSSYMIFKTRQKRYIPEFSIEINNTKIKRVNEVVFLGVVLDENLSWKPHISHISRKISK